MPAKLVVTATPKGSRIALLGSSGKQLLSSAVFTEPRAKGATLRALRGILGDDVTIEDKTTVAALKKADGEITATAEPAAPAKRATTTKRRAVKSTAKRASRTAATATRATTNSSTAARPSAARKTRSAKTAAKRTVKRIPKS